jgi:hypothetical protein
LPVFSADAAGTWPDEDFIDRAHLSARGSLRFLTALDQWLVTQR